MSLPLLLPPHQYPTSPGLLPSLHSQLQRAASSSCGSCSDCVVLSSSGAGSPTCGLCPLPCLSEPPGPSRLCLQAARPPRPATAHHHPTDVPGILRHGQSISASSMISAVDVILFFLVKTYNLFKATKTLWLFYHNAYVNDALMLMFDAVMYFNMLPSRWIKCPLNTSRTTTATDVLRLWRPMTISSTTRRV